MRRLEEIPDTGMVLLARPETPLDAIEAFGRSNGADCYVLSDLVPAGQVFVIDVDAFTVPGWTSDGGFTVGP